MRPITLTMQAFGSYGKKTEIKFTEPNQNLFLITGNTGAGKSTIFDAIVFALYGEASSGSNVKDGTELQSQFVDYNSEPFVQLTFSEVVGGATEMYTVRRVPRHIRMLKKGSGTKEEKEVVTLIMPDDSEYSQNQKETDGKIREIVGLTKSQFMQIAMIAQGEFMELLRADSNKKKEIFRKLFNTEQFKSIVEELDKRRKEKYAAISDIRIAYQTEAEHVKAPDGYKNADYLHELKRRIRASDKLNISDMEALIAELETLCDELKRGTNAAKAEYDEANKARDTKRDAYNSAKELLQAFEQLDKANEELAGCAAGEEGIQNATKLIGKINAAYEISAAYKLYEDAKRIAADTEKRLKAQQDDLPRLTQEYDRAQKAEASARAARDSELESFTKVSERVTKALEVFKKISQAKGDVENKKEALSAASTAAENARKNMEEYEVQLSQWRKTAQEHADAAKLLALWEVKSAEADSIVEDITRLKKLEAEAEAQGEKAEHAKQAYAAARRMFEDKNAEYVAKQNEFLDAQAGYIAKEKLIPHQPCPVCGSTEHPSPAVLSDGHRDLTRDVIEALSKEAGRLQSALTQRSTESGSAAELYTEKQNNCTESLAKLRERMAKTISHTPERLTVEIAEELLSDWQAGIKKEGAVLKSNAAALSFVQECINDSDVERSELKDALDAKSQGEAAARNALTAANTVLAGLTGQTGFKTQFDAEKAFEAAKKAKEEKNRVYALQLTLAQNAKTAKERASTLIERCLAELPGQRKVCLDRKSAYEKQMADKDITEPEWQDVVAQHESSEVPVLQSQINKHNTRKATAMGARNTLLKSIGNRQKPVIETLEALKDAAEKKLIEKQESLKMLADCLRADTAAYNALKPMMEERSKVAKEYARFDSLYNRFAGKVTGARMDIETFVQRYYLQRILYAANARFQDMSAGQFELRMVNVDQAGEGRNKGLDLMIYSTVTGKEREVRTLSGGESFMAALSLALGMADQIRESSASINLDIMFIDEGFGALDEHSRNQAVRVLQQMSGDSKLIGIISHVSELKQEIENQLIVSKDEHGSHVVWQIS